MNTIELKSDLHELIDKINDTSILTALKTLLSKQVCQEDFWDDLPEEIKESIEESLKQMENNETIPHNDVIQEAKQKYGL
jgi:TRAP-type C4-dicarboxylate transport system substrate-binding protein